MEFFGDFDAGVGMRVGFDADVVDFGLEIEKKTIFGLVQNRY